jgi:hypothetical protein
VGKPENEQLRDIAADGIIIGLRILGKEVKGW